MATKTAQKATKVATKADRQISGQPKVNIQLGHWPVHQQLWITDADGHGLQGDGQYVERGPPDIAFSVGDPS